MAKVKTLFGSHAEDVAFAVCKDDQGNVHNVASSPQETLIVAFLGQNAPRRRAVAASRCPKPSACSPWL